MEMSIAAPAIERLSSAVVAPAGASLRPAQSTLWAWYNDLVATLNVTTGAAGAGDTLDVAIETLDPGGIPIVIMTFTQVLGNGVFPNQQARTAQKSQSVQWFDRMQARVTRAGAGAAFTYTLVLQGS